MRDPFRLPAWHSGGRRLLPHFAWRRKMAVSTQNAVEVQEEHHEDRQLRRLSGEWGTASYRAIRFAAAIAASIPDFSLIALIPARASFESGLSADMYFPCSR